MLAVLPSASDFHYSFSLPARLSFHEGGVRNRGTSVVTAKDNVNFSLEQQQLELRTPLPALPSTRTQNWGSSGMCGLIHAHSLTLIRRDSLQEKGMRRSPSYVTNLWEVGKNRLEKILIEGGN